MLKNWSTTASETFALASWCATIMGVRHSTSSFLISPLSMAPLPYASPIVLSLSSSSMKKLSHFQLMSTSKSPPFSLCSSTVSRPPLNAYLFTLSLICFGVSVT